MNDAHREIQEMRVLVLAPTVKDGELTREILARAGIACVGCLDPVQVCEQLTTGTGAVLIAEEAVHDGGLAEWIGRQPLWSDLPVLILAREGASSANVAWAMDQLGNVTVLERPARVAGLVSAVRSALRARRRQYQLRDQLVDRERVAEQLDVAMAVAKAGSWQFDLTTREFSVSDRTIELHGLLPGKPFNLKRAWACVHPDDRASVEAAFQLTAVTGAAYWTEHRILQPDGSVRWVSSHAERRGEGGHIYIIGMVQDITERKEADERLRASEEFNRSLMDGSADCVKVLDTAGRLLHMNAPGMCLMEIDDFGPMCGQAWSVLWPAEVREHVERAVASAAEGGNYSFKAFAPTAKGTTKFWEVTVSPVRDAPSGPVVRLLSVSRDITDRMRDEAELHDGEQRMRLATEATGVGIWQWNVATGQFVGTIRCFASTVSRRPRTGAFTMTLGARRCCRRTCPDKKKCCEKRFVARGIAVGSFASGDRATESAELCSPWKPSERMPVVKSSGSWARTWISPTASKPIQRYEKAKSVPRSSAKVAE